MAKDPAFLFYPGDVLQEISLMNNLQRGIYLSLICYLHKNICISHEQLMSFTAGTNEQDIKVIIASMKQNDDGKYYIEWLKNETERRKAYSESRAKNRSKSDKATVSKDKKPRKKTEKDMSHISKSYVPHMETETVTKTEDENKTLGGVGEKKEDHLPWGSEQFSQSWDEWKDYKKKQHKFTYKSKSSEVEALRLLVEISENSESEAIKLIRHAMAQGWKGLWKIKNETNGTHSKNGNHQRNYGAQPVPSKGTEFGEL